MAKYRAVAQAIIYAYVDIEADTIDEAEDIFYDSHGKLTEESVTDFELSHITDENGKVAFYR